MRKIAILAAIAAFSATPALAAGEARIEGRGGIAFANGGSEAFAGVVAGYDFDLADKAFAGVEGSADKLLTGGTKVFFGAGARAGIKAGEKTKLFVNGGIAFNGDGSDPYIGAGIQHKFGSAIYGKIEYRRVISDGTDLNFAGLGVGLAF